LKHIFDRHTKNLAGHYRRLLIVDGHNSHLNMRFIDYADNHRILLVFLLPHFTHRFQFLDIGLFASLADYYTQQINEFVAKYQGYVSISNRHFWAFFIKAYTQAFTVQNIESAWKATGIYSFNPDPMLARIRKPKKISLSPTSPKTPGLTRALRKTFVRLQDAGHVNKEAKVLLRAAEKLDAQNKIIRAEGERSGISS
jgi:DDE superfamily endonuclease